MHLGRIGTCYLDIVTNTGRLRPGKHILPDKRSNLKAAVDYMLMSLALLRELKDREYQCLIIDALAAAYAMAGDYKSAYNFRSEYAALKETVHKDIIRFYQNNAREQLQMTGR